MSGIFGIWRRLLFLPILALSAAAPTAARAEQTASYLVTGPIGAALWGLGNEPGTQVVAFAFSQVTPIDPKTGAVATADAKLPPPGPRIAFSVTQWALLDDSWVRRQWYGDAPLTDKALVLGADLGLGTLDATIHGTLEEISEDGVVVHPDVPGRLQVQWQARSKMANTSLAYTYQTPGYAATLQTVGTGRAANATATITVEALGDPIQIWGLGTLSAVTKGLLNVTTQ
jgi:hypothetical protein